MAFPDAFLDELSARVDMTALVSRYVTLRRVGGRMVGLCPFHSEKTPSFSVSPDKQLYHCFGCGAGGGAIQFVMNIERVDFGQAVRLLAEREGMRVPEDEESLRASRLRERLIALCTEAARFFHKTLAEYSVAAEYLSRRAISPKTARHFGIGAARDSFDALICAMRDMGYTGEELLAAGLAVPNSKGGIRDKFRNRLMFPIFSERGKVIAFGGRALSDGKDSFGPKYLNSPETPIFRKNENLYALNFAKKSARKGLILAEGYMDVVSLHQSGFDNAVASLGTSLTETQARIMARLAGDVTIAYDSDQAGRKAAERAAGMLEKSGARVLIPDLGDAKDPDEFIKRYGGDRMEVTLSNSPNRLDYGISDLAKKHDLNMTQGKVDFLKACAELLAGAAGEIERDTYALKAAAMAELPPDAIKLEIERLRGIKVKKERAKTERAPVIKRGSDPPRESEFIACMLKSPELIEKFALVGGDFQSELLGRVWDHMRAGVTTFAALGTKLSESDIAKLAAASADRLIRDAETTARDCAIMIQRKKNSFGGSL